MPRKPIVWYERLPGNVRGALWMLVSALTFTMMTTLVKYLGGEYSPALQTFYRQLAAVIVILPLVLRNPGAAFRTTRPLLLFFRAAAAVASLTLAFYAYQAMPLAAANALSFTRMLWFVPLAGLILKERIGWRRITATAIGFLGVLIMLRPGIGAAAQLVPTLAALASAFLVAWTLVGMKITIRDNSLLTLVLWSGLFGLILSTPLALFEWRWPSPADLALLFAMGTLGVVNQASYAKALSLGEATAIVPVDYTRLILTAVSGFLLFGEVLDLIAIIGAVIIVGSTLYITIHEALAIRGDRAKRSMTTLD